MMRAFVSASLVTAAVMLAPLRVWTGNNVGCAVPLQHTGVTLVALLHEQHTLLRFHSSNPAAVTAVPVTGAAVSPLRAVDFSPATGVLYGISVTTPSGGLNMYRINPLTGVSYPAHGNGVVSPIAASWGASFDPQTPNRLRVINNAGLNSRGQTYTMGWTAETPLHPTPVDVDAIAYSNPHTGATATTLYGIDRASGALVMIGGPDGVPSPSGGLVTPVGSLGVVLATGAPTALDIARDGTMYAALTSASGSTGLYVIDPATGVATLVGPIGNGSGQIAGLVVHEGPASRMDFDGDGEADAAVVRDGPFSMDWYIRRSTDNALLLAGWGVRATDVLVPDDFDGDDRIDFAVWRPGSSGYFYIRRSSHGAFVAVQWGTTGDDPRVTGDYDGDGRLDLAVYRRGASPGAPSYWYVRRSADGSMLVLPWGFNDGAGGDIPVPGDYDGDSTTDVAVRRNENGIGVFYMRRSTAGFGARVWGFATDAIAPGDYDGDGTSDLVAIRSTSAQKAWYVLSLRTGMPNTATFGQASAVPAPGDYDGDGNPDWAVWRPSDLRFHIFRSASAIDYTIQWGISGDFPVAAAVVR
jgi:hypothetical protein